MSFMHMHTLDYAGLASHAEPSHISGGHQACTCRRKDRATNAEGIGERMPV